MTSPTTSGPWARKKPLPPALAPESRPPETLLRALRARVENGCPFDLARRACGVSDAVHDAWMTRGQAIHDAQPDRLYHEGGCVIAGSLEPEAEYARIATTLQAHASADLVEQVYKIAKDPARRRDQLVAIQMLLRGHGERAFDPRTENDVTVTAHSEPVVSQATIDAMTPEEIAQIREGARALSERRKATEALISAASARAAAVDAVPSTTPAPEPVTD